VAGAAVTTLVALTAAFRLKRIGKRAAYAICWPTAVIFLLGHARTRARTGLPSWPMTAVDYSLSHAIRDHPDW
jgi:hypothetical protein